MNEDIIEIKSTGKCLRVKIGRWVVLMSIATIGATIAGLNLYELWQNKSGTWGYSFLLYSLLGIVSLLCFAWSNHRMWIRVVEAKSERSTAQDFMTIHPKEKVITYTYFFPNSNIVSADVDFIYISAVVVEQTETDRDNNMGKLSITINDSPEYLVELTYCNNIREAVQSLEPFRKKNIISRRSENV